MVYRDEIEDIFTILLQKVHNNVLLVGDVGVGKTSLIYLLAEQINSLNIPTPLANRDVIEIDVMSFIAFISNREGLEGGMLSLTEDLKKFNKPILYIKNFQNIFIATNFGLTVPLAFSMLIKMLAELNVPMITEMDTSFHNRVSAENESLINTFNIVEIDEPSRAQVLEILKQKALELETHHTIEISSKILKFIYEYSLKNGFKNFSLPTSAILFLDQVSAYFVINNYQVPSSYKTLLTNKQNLVSEFDYLLSTSQYSKALKLQTKLKRLNTSITKKSNAIFDSETPKKLNMDTINEFLLEDDLDADINSDFDLLATLSSKLKNKIIGQDSAIDSVSKALIRGKLGLRTKQRPLGTFLFLGPTGVGKTELAKTLAVEAFGSNSLIRLDMSDFSEKHNVARLVGAPPGYVGYGDGGELTSKIEANPESVVLFDEIEKAHPEVLNILLQIMEEGELVDAKGQTFDFSKSVVILTSNLGTHILHNKSIGFSDDTKNLKNVEKRLRQNLKQIIKPELINRFDEVIIFNKLNKTNQRKVVNILLKEVKETLSKQGIKLKLNAKVKNYLLLKGYSDEYGARSLRRTIETELLDKVAEKVLQTKGTVQKLEAVIENDTIILN